MRRFIIFSILYIGLFCDVVFAGYIESVELLRNDWGSDDFDIGFEETQYGIAGGGLIGIGRNGLLVIGDGINRRIKIYSENGQWIRNIEPQGVNLSPLGGWPSNLKVGDEGILTLRKKFQKYDFDGSLIFSLDQKGYKEFWFGSSGEVYLQTPDKKYQKYASSGEFLGTYDQKPLALGIKTARRRADSDNRYDTTVRFEDITYHMILDGDWNNFVRDRDDYLYFFNSYTAKDPVSGEDSSTSLVVKYDPCGKKIGRLDLPISEYEPPTQEELDMPTTTLRVRNEYGPPVIGPDGSIYAWKRTPDTYSILKWEWVDDPSDPKPGPDTPENFNVIPSTQGLYVSWDLAPQDPGCVDSYEIERATSADGIYSPLTTVEKGNKSYNDATVLQGQDYFYRLRAVADDLYSDFTNSKGGKRE